MGNPIALVFSLRRLLVVCFSAILCYGALAVTTPAEVDGEAVTDASDITRVELLR